MSTVNSNADAQRALVALLGDLAFTTLATVNMVSTGAFVDPNGCENAAVTDQAGGLLRFDMNQTGSTTNLPSTGATYRFNKPSGWVGDGTKGMVLRQTMQAGPGGVPRRPRLNFGLCDRSGDPTHASAVYVGGSVVGNASMNDTDWITSVLSGPSAGSNSAEWTWQSDREILTWILPLGSIGDEGNAGAQPGYLGNALVTTWDTGSGLVVVTPQHGISVVSVVNDPLYLTATMGMVTTGAANKIVDAKLEVAVFNHHDGAF